MPTHSVQIRLDCRKPGLKHIGEVFSRRVPWHMIRFIHDVTNIQHLFPQLVSQLLLVSLPLCDHYYRVMRGTTSRVFAIDKVAGLTFFGCWVKDEELEMPHLPVGDLGREQPTSFLLIEFQGKLEGEGVTGIGTYPQNRSQYIPCQNGTLKTADTVKRRILLTPVLGTALTPVTHISPAHQHHYSAL